MEHDYYIDNPITSDIEREIMFLLNKSQRQFDYGYGVTGPLHILLVNRNKAAKSIAAYIQQNYRALKLNQPTKKGRK